jgi:anti-sigma regulatory factor (Ser/Thr protein kinase)
MKSRRHRLLVGAVVLLVVVIAVGLAVAAPVLAVLGLVGIALVVGLVARLPRASRPQRATGRRDGPSDADDDAETGPSGPLWVMQWETRPPVDAVPFARDQLARELTDWGIATEAGEPTLLVATELLTNAVEHARAPIRLTVRLAAECVRIEVHDAAADPPRQQPHDLWAPRGRGLQLVDGLSRRWGWSPDTDGKTVWADVSSGWPP